MGNEVQSGSPPSDSSAFVEHLRLVHFALVVACLIAVIAVTSQAPTSAARAYDQANQLWRIADLWNGGGWLHEFAAQKGAEARGDMTPPMIDVELFEPQTSPVLAIFSAENRLRVDLRSRWRLANLTGPIASTVSIGADIRISDNDDNSRRERGPSFDNLDGAVKIWDRLNSYRYFVVLNKVIDGWFIRQGFDARFVREPRNAIKLVVEENAAAIAGDTRTTITAGYPGMMLREDLLRFLKRGPYLFGEPRPVVSDGRPDPNIEDYSTLLKLVSDDRITWCYFFDQTQRMVLRADCAIERLSLQSLLISGFAPTPPLGNFARSFPDLDDLTKHLRALSLDDMRTFLEAEKNRATEKVELLSVKLPGETVTSWGVMMLLVIGGYFLSMFRDFSWRVKPDDKAWNVPWLGTSPRRVSQIAFLMSMLVVLSAIGYLALRGFNLSSSIWTQLLHAAASVIAIGIVWQVLSIWHDVLGVQGSHKSV